MDLRHVTMEMLKWMTDAIQIAPNLLDGLAHLNFLMLAQVFAGMAKRKAQINVMTTTRLVAMAVI